MHIIRTERIIYRRRTTCFRVADSDAFESLHFEYRDSIEAQQFEWLAENLRVTADALRRLELGWCEKTRKFTFPIRRPSGQVVGIATRSVNGTKKNIYGSAASHGLFIPVDLEPGKALFVPEGASDTASLLSLGLNATGRTSISTFPNLVQRYAQLNGFNHIIAVADNDEHGRGQEAAAALANYLKAFRCRSYLLIPPVKDIRQWIDRGATVKEIRERVEHV